MFAKKNWATGLGFKLSVHVPKMANEHSAWGPKVT